MSLKFLTLPLYLTVCIFISGSLVFTAIRRYYKDRKTLILIYLTVAIMPILAALGRVFYQQTKYTASIKIGFVITFILLILELVYGAITHSGNERSKLLIALGFGLIVVSLIPVLVLLIID